ncbi:MAG: hypothetical protein R3C08_05685 [Hyphomonas sp.]
MKPLLNVVAAVVLGIACYIGIFAFVIEQPLSIGIFDRVFSYKRAYARQIDEPKTIVAAGSSGFYSVRCETIAEETGMPCVNLSIALALGRETMMQQVEQVAKPGDVVLLPWEFRLYYLNAEDMRARISYPYIVRYEKGFLKGLGPKRALDALFYFDPKYLMGALIETKEYVGGKRHGFDEEGRMTRQGDYQGHTEKVAVKYRDQVEKGGSSASETGKIAEMKNPPAGLEEFISWANSRDISVYAVLPPSVDSIPVSDDAVEHLHQWFSSAKSGGFIDISGNLQYPYTCFYDTREHLREECQIEHSHEIGKALAARLSAR